MKIGLIVDRMGIARWQSEALKRVAVGNEFIVYNCTNGQPARRSLRHTAYYLLNLQAVRNRMTRRTALPTGLKIAAHRNFTAPVSGTWQALPDSLLDVIYTDAPAVIVKFGMGLLQVPPRDRLAAPILSFHHGDPARYRGRPAGFYELLNGERTMGQVVQILSNDLDSGTAMAAAETRVFPQSYKATLIEAYRHSPLLLKPAIEQAIKGTAAQSSAVGKNYRLPRNSTVLRLVGQLLKARFKRFVYGAFFEKHWQVATSPPAPSADLPIPVPDVPEEWAKLPLPAGYRFIADPFPHPRGGVLAEALRRTTGLGEILHLDSDGARPIGFGCGHFSYPAPFHFAGEDFLLPEVSEWSPPLLYRFDGGGLAPLGELRVAGTPRLVDPTIHSAGVTLFLFANDSREAATVLRLWTATYPSDEFVEHPVSPILVSPAGARMGGLIFSHGGQPYRVGQDTRGAYGDGILLFRIDALTLEAYRETPVGNLRFSHCRGPHTLNVAGSDLLFDFYVDRFSILAGARRLRSIAQRRLRRGRSDTGANILHAPHN